MTRTAHLAASAALLLVAAPAFAQSTGAVQPSAPPAPQQGVSSGAVSPSTTSTGSPEATKPTGTPVAGTLNATDQLFVRRAALGGMTEVEEGKLASSQAKSPDVKSFGEHMVAEHAAAGDKLKSIATAEGASPPTALTPAETKQVAALQKLKGAAFDKRYAKAEVKAHQDTIQLFQQEAASGGDARLKQFASDTLPTLQGHLKDAQALGK